MSPSIDLNNVLLVNRRALEDRLDCYFNKALISNPIRSKYKSVSLYKLVNTFSGGTPDKGNSNFWNGDIAWVSPKDFKSLEISYSEDKITEDGLKFSASKLVNPENVIIVVRSGILQHTIPIAIAKLPVAINQDVKALEINDKSVLNPYYLVYYFKTFQDKILPLIVKYGTTVQSINTEQFEKLKIPVPSIDIQTEIVEIYNQAYNLKHQKEIEAKALLSGIDDYLSEKLGIELPTHKDTKKVFYGNSSEVFGKRFDPYYHQSEFKKIETNIRRGKYPLVKIRDISENIINGFDSREFSDNGIMYLRVGNIKKSFFDLDDVKYINPVSVITKKIQLQAGDLLITRKGTYGNAAVVDDSLVSAIISSEVFRLPLKQNCNPYYIAFWINSLLGQIVFDRVKTGGIMGHITQDVLGSIEIPFPSIDIQNEIDEFISDLHRQAKKLENEAMEAIETAKLRVEKMILQ